MRDALYDFFKLQSAGGICLVAAAALFVGSLAFPEADAALGQGDGPKGQ